MFEVRIKTDFAAAHHLNGYPGDCARVHGHNWGVETFFHAESLDQIGMACDFRELKAMVKGEIEPWDHQDLNALSDFKNMNPSAENVSKLLYSRIQKALSKNGLSSKIKLARITIWENERCSASYFE